MKKRHPKLPEQLEEEPSFHLQKAVEVKLNRFGCESILLRYRHIWLNGEGSWVVLGMAVYFFACHHCPSSGRTVGIFLLPCRSVRYGQAVPWRHETWFGKSAFSTATDPGAKGMGMVPRPLCSQGAGDAVGQGPPRTHACDR